MFHWCPEETAAVIAAGSAAAFGLVWVKAHWFIFVGWLRRKLGLVDKRHCCLHVAPNRAGPPRPDERMLTKEDVMVSFEAVREADRVIRVVKHRDFRPDQNVILSNGIHPLFDSKYVRRYREGGGRSAGDESYQPPSNAPYPLDLEPLPPEES